LKESICASDHVILAPRDQGQPGAPDESIPWLQGFMVMYQQQTPRLHRHHDRSLASVA
jgi:hypothetical protein